MLAGEPGFKDVAGQQRKQRRAATTGFQIIRRRGGHALEPNLPVMPKLCGQTICPEKRVREPPTAPRKLAEGLAHPAGQREIIEPRKNRTILLPEPVARRFRISAHAHTMEVANPNIKVEVLVPAGVRVLLFGPRSL